MKIIIFLISVFINFQIYSKQENPYFFIENIIEQTKPCLIKSDSNCLEKLMEKYLDLNEISIWISGKTIWINSSEVSRLEFLEEIKKLILKTYNKTVSYYIDSDVVFLKNKNDNFNDQKRIQILSIMKKNGKNVYITYRLIKNEDTWLVFDVVIEGVSILRSLQTQYSNLIKENGLDYVIKKIRIINE